MFIATIAPTDMLTVDAFDGWTHDSIVHFINFAISKRYDANPATGDIDRLVNAFAQCGTFDVTLVRTDLYERWGVTPTADTDTLTAWACARCFTGWPHRRSTANPQLCHSCDGNGNGGRIITALDIGDGWHCSSCQTTDLTRRHHANLMYCVGCYAILLGAIEQDDAA